MSLLLLLGGQGNSRTASDSVSTSDSVSQTRSIVRSASDSVTTSDEFRKADTPVSAADTVSTSDAVSQNAAYARSASDSVATSSAVTRTAGLNRTISSTLTTSSTVTKAAAHPRTTSDTVSTSDANVVVDPYRLADFVSTSAVPTRILDARRTITSTLTTSSTVARTGQFFRTASASLTTEDHVGTPIFVTAADSVSTSTAVTSTQTTSQAADSLTAGATVSRTGAFRRTVSSSLSTSSTVARSGQFFRTATAGLTLTDHVGVPITTTATDSVTTTDHVGAQIRVTAEDTIIFSVGETLTRQIAYGRTATDTVATTSVSSFNGASTVSRYNEDTVFFDDEAAVSPSSVVVYVPGVDPPGETGTGGGGGTGPSTGLPGGSSAGASSVVRIMLDGTPITNLIEYSSAVFVSAVNGVGGTCSFTVRDLPHSFTPVIGKSLTVDIDGRRMWSGFAMSAARTYAFAADDTSDPTTTERLFLIQGVDNNTLFQRRVAYNKAHPERGELPPPTGRRCSSAQPGMWEPGTPTSVIVPYLIEHYTDMFDDGITMRVSNFGSPMPDNCGAVSAAVTVGDMMADLNRSLAGVFYLTPKYQFRYHDTDTVTSAYKLTDMPDPDDVMAIGPRAYNFLSDGGSLINDALVWGTAVGWSTVNFSRAEDDNDIARVSSITDHGRWQYGEFNTTIHRQATVDERAHSIVYGQTASKEGARWDKVAVEAIVHQPVFNLGDVVTCESYAYTGTLSKPFDVTFDNGVGSGVLRIDLPIRRMEISFIGPNHPRFRLTLTREIDDPFSAFESRFLKPKLPGLPGIPPIHIPDPHIPGGPPEPTGCSDAICGITDSFNRTIAANQTTIGTSDYGLPWVVLDGGVGATVEVTPETGLIINVPAAETFGTEVVLGALVGQMGVPLGTPAGIVHVEFDVTFTDFVPGQSSRFVVNSSFVTAILEPGIGSGVANSISFSHGLDYVYFPLDWEQDVRYTVRISYGVPSPTLSSIGLNVFKDGVSVADLDLPDIDLSVSPLDSFSIEMENEGSPGIFRAEIDELNIYSPTNSALSLNRCSAVQFDDFGRTVDPGWGTTNSGLVWQNNFGDTNLSVNGAVAQWLVIGSPNLQHAQQYVNDGGAVMPWTTGTVFTMTSRFQTDLVWSDNSDYQSIQWGWSRVSGPDVSYVGVQIDNTPLHPGTLSIINPNGDEADLPKSDWVADQWYTAKAEVEAGVLIKFKVWADGEAEPDWMLELADSAGPLVVGDTDFIIDFFGRGGGTVSIGSIDFDYDGKPCYSDCDNTAMLDHFEGRTETNGWGTSSSGVAWSTGGNSKYSVADGLGKFDLRGLGNGQGGFLQIEPTTTMPLTLHDTFRLDRDYTDIPFAPSGGNNNQIEWVFNTGDGSYEIAVNFHAQRLNSGPHTFTTVLIVDRIGTGTSFAQEVLTHDDISSVILSSVSADVPLYFADTWYERKIRLANGEGVQWKIWESGTAEPDWHTSTVTVPADFTASGILQINATNPLGTSASTADILYEFDYIELVNCVASSSTDVGDGSPAPGPTAGNATRISDVIFQVARPYVAGTTHVSVNGVTKQINVDYTESPNDATVTFTTPIDTADTVYIAYTAVPQPIPSGTPFAPPVTTQTVSVPAGYNISQINSLVASNPSATVFSFSSGSTYTLTAGILMAACDNIILEGNGATLTMSGSDAETFSTFLSRGSSHVLIRNFTVHGAYFDYPNQHGEGSHCLGLSGFFGGRESSFIEMTNITGDHFFGDFAYFEGENVGTQRPSHDIWIHNNVFDYCGRNGVSPINVTDFLIENNTFDHMAYHTFDCEPNQNAEEIRRGTFRNNIVGEFAARSGLIGHFFSCFSPNNAPIVDITVSGNTVAGIAADGVFGNPRGLHVTILGEAAHRYQNITVTNNTCSRTVAGSGVIYAQNTDRVTVTGNTQPLSSGTLVVTSGCTNVTDSPNP